VGPLAARRVTMPDLPIPFSAPLEDWALPDAGAVARAARELAPA
jgi:pyruvate/2-oxoglutarate/acetoin dehydrogenase E1 component